MLGAALDVCPGLAAAVVWPASILPAQHRSHDCEVPSALHTRLHQIRKLHIRLNHSRWYNPRFEDRSRQRGKTRLHGRVRLRELRHDVLDAAVFHLEAIDSLLVDGTQVGRVDKGSNLPRDRPAHGRVSPKLYLILPAHTWVCTDRLLFGTLLAGST